MAGIYNINSNAQRKPAAIINNQAAGMRHSEANDIGIIGINDRIYVVVVSRQKASIITRVARRV